MQAFDFKIISGTQVSALFLQRGIQHFSEAADLIRRLPYSRNKNKQDVTTVLTDGCGTCSTKHALLQLLALENGQTQVQLMLGIIKMRAADTPKIRTTLRRHGLEYLPEAHNYLRIDGQIADYTWEHPLDFSKDLLAEEVISPDQITAYKVKYHQAFLKTWLEANKAVPFSPEALWAIREQCIRDLAG